MCGLVQVILGVCLRPAVPYDPSGPVLPDLLRDRTKPLLQCRDTFLRLLCPRQERNACEPGSHMIIVHAWGRARDERALLYGTGEYLYDKELNVLPKACGYHEKLLFVLVRRSSFENRAKSRDFGDVLVVKRLVLLSLGRLGILLQTGKPCATETPRNELERPT